MLAIFETIAITLYLAKDNLFYLLNFSYSGFSIALGLFLFIKKYRHARRVTQLLVGLYMLLYLGLACNENMQIEGFWYYLFTGVFEAATIHYAVAKIFGPLHLGWSVRYKRRLSYDIAEMGNCWYVPGYGKAGSTRLGGTFNIMLNF